jgi:hypothetical protein
MTPEPNCRPSQEDPDSVAEDATMARAAADARKDDASLPVAAAADGIHRIQGETMPPETPRVSRPRRRRASEPPKSRRLGPLEYTLLVLIALGIAITVVMAIVNPSS